MSINILPQNIANQIAAGEVVERPASVVKELIENSIDAQATQIQIYIKNGGKSLIKIIDNGLGMSPDDTKKSILRHATSKIKNIEDLFSIGSFGFRGEALAAISAVSDFQLISKTTEQDFGSTIKVFNEKKEFTKNIPANCGTQILIKDLFCTTPARKQYLKTDETEYREILKEIKAFALANFEIGFKLFKDERNVLDLPKATKREQRIQQIFKKNKNQFASVKLETPHLKITGFTSRPEYCIANRNQQYLFVNGRKITDFKLAFAIREAYNQSCGIGKHLHPFWVIFIEIDPILVDVNVHPRKLEVKFSEPQEIFSAIKKAISDTLLNSSNSPTSFVSNKPFTNFPQKPSRKQISNSANFNQFLSQPSPQKNNQTNLSLVKESNYQPLISEKSDFSEENQLGELRLIGQISQKYIIAESDNGVFFFDQHALHERQRFEYFWEKIKNQKPRTQKLLINQVITLSEEQISLLSENKKTLKDLKFSFRFPADDKIEITDIPDFLKNENLEKIIQSIIEFLENESIGEHSIDILLRQIIEYKACRGAVMFGDKLNTVEMEKMLHDLKNTKFKWLCAHGRPNYWFIPFEELDKKFHR